VEDRLTLVMERVGGSTLRRWLEQHRQPDLNTLRRYAEDLLAALEYLEQKGVTHKDLKPDNLLVGDDGLKVIDFSLALMVEDAPFGGTALYRDPASLRWTHATDRYAAALCLFELYTGRHAFEGRAPEPGEQLRVAEQDIDPPGLAAFFAKALHPVVEQRFPSARALRDALLAALGERPDVEPEVEPTPTEQLDATTDLRLTSLSRRAVNQLRRASILTVGELLALTEQQVRAIHAIGHKTAREILDFQQELQRRGLRPELQPRRPEAVLVPELADSAEPIQKLAIPAALQRALFEGGLTTVGLLAGSTRSELLRMEGIGSGRLAQLLEALRQFKDRTAPPGGPATLDALWHLASRPLAPPQVDALERHLGLTGLPATQSEVAEALGTTQSQVSTLCTGGLERLDRAPLSEPSMVVDVLLEGLHGLCLLSEAGRRLEESWPPERIGGEGMLRLLVRLAGDRLRLVEVDGLSGPVLARPAFTPAMLQRFVQETYRLAEQWPPADPEPTRKALQAALPEFEGDPLALALRLCDDVKLTESGKLFIPPVDPPQSLKLVLDEARLPLSLEELAQRVHETFQGGAPFPEQAHLLEVLGQLGFQVQGGQVVGSRERGFTAPPGRPDPLPQQLGPERTHELIVRDLLRQASASRGFRMLVTPPERHAAIGKSVAQALGGHYHSFEQAWFERHGAELVRME
ncbi:MAG: hypothetical protein FJ125_12845, partial [Deltaproteobacteria bacterium]|nr:hypothetical protein [Deltaproteobacteria bacterium]